MSGIVRATAVALLGRIGSPNQEFFEQSLADGDALVRTAAVQTFDRVR